MVVRRETECEADALQTTASQRHIGIEANAERFQNDDTAAARRDGAIAMLHDRNNSSCDHEGSHCADVEGTTAVAAGAESVERVAAPTHGVDAEKNHALTQAGGGGGELGGG